MTTAAGEIAIHEALEVRELLTFKNICLTKSKTMQVLVTDEQLRTILQQDVQQSAQNINELQGILNQFK